MAKVTITFRDKKSGKVGVEAEFSPRIKEGHTLTDAQMMAGGVLQALQQLAVEGQGEGN